MSQSAKISTGNPGKKFWIACGKCDAQTQHEAMVVVEWHDDSPEYDFTEWRTYMIVVCCGCRTVSFCIESRNSEDLDYDSVNHATSPSISYTLFPSRVAGRREIGDLSLVPKLVQNVYRDTLSALLNQQRVLAGIGIRAIVEAVCNEKKVAGKRLEQRIDGLVTKDIITTNNAKVLHRLRFMGNRSAHEVRSHSIDELGTAFTIIENLLQNAYIIPKRSKKLPRPRRRSIVGSKTSSSKLKP